jgi:hypothetical protein
MKVFLGGSRQLARLNKNIRQYLDDTLKKSPTILVGDANGSDKAIQQYLFEKKYQDVLVYSSGFHCRNNVGSWQVRYVQSDRTTKDFAFYTAKDQQMSMETDTGLMLWDGKSKGTLNNILNLLENGKKSSVYYSPKKLFITLGSLRDLTHLLKNCDRASLDYFEKSLHLNDRLHSDHGQLSLV